MNKEEEIQNLKFLLALDEAKLTLKKYDAGLIEKWRCKEHLQMDLRDFINWMEGYNE